MKSLTITDIETDDLGISASGAYIINLNIGRIKTDNCKNINLKNFNDKLVQSKLFNFIFKELKKFKYPSFFETETANLRNDKNLNISKIINILKIKSYTKKFLFTQINLITSDQGTVDSIKSIYPNVNVISKKKIKLKNSNIGFFVLKFYIKSFFIILFLKVFSQSKLISKKLTSSNECFMSLHPNFFYNNKENFFNKKKKNFLLLNFLLTDETHLNYSLLEILKNYYSIKKKLICLESFINIRDIFLSYKNYLKFHEIYKKKLSNRFLINNVDFTNLIKKNLDLSIINRSKLFLTSSGLTNLFSKKKFLKFHLYLFEYNFGFFLIREIKKHKIKVLGYQHGIFSKKMYWMNIILKLQNKLFFPDTVISNSKKSFKDYKYLLKKKVNKIVFKKKEISSLAKKIQIRKKNSLSKINKILILSGTHDIRDIVSFCQKEYAHNKNLLFFIKVHPKNKYFFKDEINIKKINNIEAVVFDSVIISPTSTLAYDFDYLNKKYSIFNSNYKYC
jgi:hypothetical protein